MSDIPKNGVFPGYTIPLEEEPAIAALVGIIIGLHTSMEEKMRDLLSWVTEMDQRYSRILFYSLPSRARRETLKECLSLRLSDEEFQEWVRLIDKKIKSVSDRRNELAHHQFMGNGKAGQIITFDPRLSPFRKSTSVITVKSLERLRYDLGKLNRELMEKIHLMKNGTPLP